MGKALLLPWNCQPFDVGSLIIRVTRPRDHDREAMKTTGPSNADERGQWLFEFDDRYTVVFLFGLTRDFRGEICRN